MKQRTRITLASGVAVVAIIGIFYAVSAFPPPSNTRCIATDPPAMFYVVLNEDGTFSRVE